MVLSLSQGEICYFPVKEISMKRILYLRFSPVVLQSLPQHKGANDDLVKCYQLIDQPIEVLHLRQFVKECFGQTVWWWQPTGGENKYKLKISGKNLQNGVATLALLPLLSSETSLLNVHSTNHLFSEKLDYFQFFQNLKKTEQPSLSKSESLWESGREDNFWFSASHWDALNQISKNSVLDLASLSFAASPASMSSGTDWMSTGTRAARAATRATMVYQQSGHQSYARNCGRFPSREGRPTAFQRMYKNEYNSI